MEYPAHGEDKKLNLYFYDVFRCFQSHFVRLRPLSFEGPVTFDLQYFLIQPMWK
jgi:hypothetical protein